MLIYIEGIDKSGKSTFAERMSALLDIPIYRKFMPPDLCLKEHHSYFKGIGFALAQLHNIFGFNAIVDRSFVSDWVYSNRNSDAYPFAIWSEWEKLHKTPHDVIIVYIETPELMINCRLAVNPDSYMAPNDITRFLSLYRTYFEQTRFRVFRVSGVASEAEQVAAINDVLRLVNK